MISAPTPVAPSAGLNPADQAKFDAILQAHNYVPPAQPGGSAPAQNWRSLVTSNPLTPTAPIAPSTPVVSNPLEDIKKAGADVHNAVTGEDSGQGIPGEQSPAQRSARAGSAAAGGIVNTIADVLPGVKPALAVAGKALNGAEHVAGNIGNTMADISQKLGIMSPAQRAEYDKRASDFSNSTAGQVTTNVADTLNNLGNIANTILGTKGVAEGVPSVIKTAKDTLTTVKGIGAVSDTIPKNPSQSPVVPPLNEVKINDLYNRAIKPTVAGKTNAGQIAQANTQTVAGLQAISDNKPNLTFTNADGETVTNSTPKSVDQLSQAIQQTKASIYKQYDTLAKQAGEQGVTVDTTKIGAELAPVIESRSLAIANPKAVQYAKDVQERLNQTGTVDAQTAQDVIQHYNESLKAFYRNPSYETASQASVDALIANKFREQLDAGITGATGEQYQALKNQYGALSSMEKDVARRNVVWGRQNSVGLAGNLANITSGAELVRGLISMNPADIAASVAIKSVQKYMQYLNNPDVGVSRIFSEIGKSGRPSTGNTMESGAAGKTVEPLPSNVTQPSTKVNTGVSDLFNKFVNMAKGTKIENPTATIDSGAKASKDIVKIIGAKDDSVSFTNQSLKHLAEKGKEGDRLLGLIPDILKSPDEIRQGLSPNRFLISKTINDKPNGSPHAISLEVTEQNGNIIVTAFQTSDSYLKDFDSLWKAAPLPSQQDLRPGGSSRFSALRENQNPQNND